VSWFDALFQSQYTLVSVVVAFCAFVIFAFSKSWLMTRWQVQGERDQAEKRVADRDAIIKDKDKVIDLLQQQLDRTTVVGEATVKVLDSLPLHNGEGDSR
jgi:cytochrome c-type biogenesis protein CcmH/NrfG